MAHKVDADSEQGKRVMEVTDELLDILDEFDSKGYPAGELVSSLTSALAVRLAEFAGRDDSRILHYVDQIRSVLMSVHTEYTMKDIVGDPAND